MNVLNAFRTQRQLAARGQPLRAPVHKLNGTAKILLGVAYVIEIASIVVAGKAQSAAALWACLALLLLCHVATYAIVSRTASLKPRRNAPAA